MKKENENKLYVSLKGIKPEDLTTEQIMNYFMYVRKLQESGEPYPVDLDEVWPLAYNRKDNAVKVLKKKFLKNVEYVTQMPDYQRFRQMAEPSTTEKTDSQRFVQMAKSSVDEKEILNETSSEKVYNVGGDYKTVIYKLSVSCFEYLVVRERKPIFEIYRRVFILMQNAMKHINGVYPIFYKGQILYNYNEILRSVGFSTRSGAVSKRKRLYPQSFMKVGTNNYILAEFAHFLIKQKEFMLLQNKMKSAQGVLPFKED